MNIAGVTGRRGFTRYAHLSAERLHDAANAVGRIAIGGIDG